ncbi:hypothetical protein [Loktanella sp. S4079]|uniref:hypothetical protein n=1 Tax=Loktanella sp. S4079 TaxID=579483 RepID=UPI0005FA75C4|nr:hypothetical protein [Loktanella sp. S4079]KJZ16888.1 hypothetical protein TW80_17495 [Loktanella sp. S4079]
MTDHTAAVADKLAALYTSSFGGKETGRYRLPQKLLRELFGVRRLYPDDITSLSRALFERGYVLIDMDSFYVVMSANSFVNYRRLSAEAIRDEER